jgi:hypothetical protein
MAATKETAVLGSTVKDIVTGFEGMVVARTEWLNGCFRVHVQPTTLKDGKPMDAISFDVQQVEVQPKAVLGITPVEKAPGGPFDEPKQAADPTAN